MTMNEQEKEKRFQDLYRENHTRIYRLCYGYALEKNEVDDLFQEIMVNLWRNLEKFRGDSKLSTWVYRVAVNTALLYNKRIKRKETVELEKQQPDPKETDNAEKLELIQDLARLQWCLNQLKKQDRLIMTLMLEDMSYKEIAEVVGISVSHVGVKINRIKQLLASCVDTTKANETNEIKKK